MNFITRFGKDDFYRKAQNVLRAALCNALRLSWFQNRVYGTAVSYLIGKEMRYEASMSVWRHANDLPVVVIMNLVEVWLPADSTKLLIAFRCRVVIVCCCDFFWRRKMLHCRVPWLRMWDFSNAVLSNLENPNASHGLLA